MQELMLRPTIYRFQTCQEFVDQYHIGEGDLILSFTRRNMALASQLT